MAKSRVGKIICDKGGARKGMARPTFFQTPETSYLDGSRSVFFKEELVEKEKKKEKVDVKQLFEAFHK